MVRLENPGVLCWHNASVFAVLHLLKACGITIPVETFETGRETYMSHFVQWSHLATSELRNPWFSLELFVREFMPDEVTVSEIRNNSTTIPYNVSMQRLSNSHPFEMRWAQTMCS